MNTNYRLQLRSHKEVFTDRESAMEYIGMYFMPDNLVGEPTVYFYGNKNKPNVILAIGGVGDRTYTTIDIAETNERLDNVDKGQVENTAELAKAVATLKGVIEASGLTFDANKKENQVTYEPDVKDELIGDAENLAEAISILSKYAQENFHSSNLIPETTKSIEMLYVPVDEGMQLKAAIRISKHGESDTTENNDNIIGLKEDGLYATVNVDYDEVKHELQFVTSGMKNGKFMDDANRKVISLGEHTQYAPDNEKHNVSLVVNKEKNTLSADVKISEDENNILSVQDDKLFVDGRANNIKYKGQTVFAGLNNLEKVLETVNSDLEDLKEHVEKVENHDVIKGDTTDTMVVTAQKQETGGYVISGGVRLGSEQSIIIKNGGIEADVEITCEPSSNKLKVRVGNTVKEVVLPGFSIVNTISYDSANNDLVITWSNGQTTKIPIADLVVNTYNFVNDASNSVEFSVNDGDTRNIKNVTANVRVSKSTDNILTVVNGELMVDKTKIKADVTGLNEKIDAEIERAKAAEQANADAIVAEKTRAEAKEAEIKNQVDINTNNIGTLQTTVTANGEKLTTLEGKVNEFKSEYDTYVGNNDKTVAGVKEVLARHEESITKNASDILTSNKNLENEVNRATARENEIERKLQEHIDSASSDLEADVEALKTSVGELTTQVTTIDSSLDKEIQDRKDADGLINESLTKVTSDVKTNTSNISSLTDELHSLAENYTKFTETASTVHNQLAENVKTLNTSIGEAQSSIGTLETSLNKEIDDRKASDTKFDNSIAEINTKVGTIENNVTKVNGDLAAEVSRATLRENEIEKKLEDHIDSATANIEETVVNLGERVGTLETNLQSEITRATGEESRIEGKLDTHVTDAESKFTAINGNIDTIEANVTSLSDRMTVAESDIKNTKDSLSTLTERVSTNEADIIKANNDIAANKLAIENLKAEDAKMAISVQETNTLKLAVDKQNTGSTISGDVKVKSDVRNAIASDGNGLYANIQLSYNKASNKISLVVNEKTVDEYELSDHSIVQEGHYDSQSKSIILTIIKDGGEREQISIPVADLVNEWKVDNGEDNPVNLSKTTGADGVDVLRATLNISTDEHNAILDDNGTLFASNEASKMFALWGGDEITIQKAIENIKTETDKVEGLVTDVDQLQSDMVQAKNDITQLQGDVNMIQVKVEQNTKDIATNTGSINTLNTQVTELNREFTNISNSFNELSDLVNTYEERITTVEGDIVTINNNINSINQNISDIKEQIGEPQEGKPNIYERLDAIENTIANLIDFGTF